MRVETPSIDAAGLRVALLVSRFNHLISIRLIDGARGAEIPDEGIAAVLEDRAERERRRVEAAGQ